MSRLKRGGSRVKKRVSIVWGARSERTMKRLEYITRCALLWSQRRHDEQTNSSFAARFPNPHLRFVRHPCNDFFPDLEGAFNIPIPSSYTLFLLLYSILTDTSPFLFTVSICSSS